MSSGQLPFKGKIHAPSAVKFKETVVIVPFFGAHRAALRKHIEFCLELGYVCVDFELLDGAKDLTKAFLPSSGKFGLKTVWADQIEMILNEIKGDKIIYAFSNPSASAIEAVVRRHAIDVKALICEGGPSGQFLQSMYRYFTVETPIKYLPLRLAASLASALAWDPFFTKAVHKDLEKMPSNLPILSVRGWKDPLITPQMIDRIFEPHKNVDWRKLGLPKAEHVNGLKDFPDEYKPSVAQFLTENSSPS